MFSPANDQASRDIPTDGAAAPCCLKSRLTVALLGDHAESISIMGYGTIFDWGVAAGKQSEAAGR